jgi:serine/threonine protein kinase
MGVLLYQCLTGETPVRGNYGALYKAHLERAPDINVLPPETPPSLRSLVSRCLEKRQERRPKDAGECVSMLRRAEAELAEASGGAGMNEPGRKLGSWVSRRAP